MQKNLTQTLGSIDNTRSLVSQLKVVPFNVIRIIDGFWKTRQSINREISLKHGYIKLEEAGNFHNLRMAAKRTTGEYHGINFFDEDVYKWLEALAWELGREPDSVLQQIADEVIDLIMAAQLPDGYLNSYYQVAAPDSKWSDLDFGHELYCAGHLFQAAIAFKRAIGDERLMDVACRFADHINTVFGQGKKQGTSGHPEVEMALVELYRATQHTKYLDLAQFFIDQRGKNQMRGMGSNGAEYHQDHVPVREATGAAGHAVRQMYLLAGIADIYMETREQALWEVTERFWRDITGSKMYVTGGVGSRYDGESFGEPYELPPDQCYCETCAAIGSLMWNWRLLLITGEGRYADMIERALYNGILSSPALDGKHYFYVNPLMVRSEGSMRHSTNRPDDAKCDGRPEWHLVACCPPNVMRLLSSLTHYFTTTNTQGIQIHQYASSEMDLSFGQNRQVNISVETEYPWEGDVKISIDQNEAFSWSFSLRIPGWCEDYCVMINGEKIVDPFFNQGYLVIDRTWSSGDILDLSFSMPPKFVYPHPRIDAVRGCVALQRGPLVYCFEEHDQVGTSVLVDGVIDQEWPLQLHKRNDLLGGIYTIEANGSIVDNNEWEDRLYDVEPPSLETNKTQIPLTAIPYYVWGNRGLKGMRVWIPKD